MKSFLFEGRSLPKTSKKKKKNPSQILLSSNLEHSNFPFEIQITSDLFFSLLRSVKIASRKKRTIQLGTSKMENLEEERKSGGRRSGNGGDTRLSPLSLSLSSQGETARRRWDDKKAPAGVIMITAVQRKTECCGARMAAVGSWEIGILERHFRVSGSCYQPPTTNNPVFRLLVPWPFPSPNLETRLSLS